MSDDKPYEISLPSLPDYESSWKDDASPQERLLGEGFSLSDQAAISDWNSSFSSGGLSAFFGNSSKTQNLSSNYVFLYGSFGLPKREEIGTLPLSGFDFSEEDNQDNKEYLNISLDFATSLMPKEEEERKKIVDKLSFLDEDELNSYELRKLLEDDNLETLIESRSTLPSDIPYASFENIPSSSRDDDLPLLNDETSFDFASPSLAEPLMADIELPWGDDPWGSGNK